MTKTNDPRCATCGHHRSNHPYRHPFAGPGSPLAPRPKGKTKRVRIAVAVDVDGVACIAGMGAARSNDDRRFARHCLEQAGGRVGPGDRISIIEADVPLPEEPATVRGEVVDG